jgi:hypothetical protein
MPMSSAAAVTANLTASVPTVTTLGGVVDADQREGGVRVEGPRVADRHDRRCDGSHLDGDGGDGGRRAAQPVAPMFWPVGCDGREPDREVEQRAQAELL